MNRDDIIKIGKKSGRLAFKGVAIATDVAKEAVEINDTLMSNANSLAGEFSGYSGSTPAKDLAKDGTKKGLSLAKKLALKAAKELD